MNFLRPFLLLAGACGLLPAGCQKPTEPPAPKRSAESSLKQIAVLFGQYTRRNRGQSPKNEADFRKFITENGKRALNDAAVSSVDELLTSPRDNEPFQVRYGLKVGPPGKSGGPIVAYEKTGSGGSRYAVDSLGSVKQMSQSELDDALKQ